MKIKNTEVLG